LFSVIGGHDSPVQICSKIFIMETKARKTIAVIGLGSMGKKLVELLKGKYDVIVWNRSRAKADELTGIHVAESPEAAIRQAVATVICVYDYEAVKDILYGIQDKMVFNGKTLINFTTGNPEETAEMESLIAAYKGYYINGALQVAPNQMGLEDTTILLSGNREAFEKEQTLLQVFGGNLHYLGAAASLASAVDLASLSWLYGSYVGLLYAVELCIRSGVALPQFNKILTGIVPGFTAFFEHQIATIDRGDFTVTQSPLAISVAATERIKRAFQQQGVPTDFWKSITDLLQQADRQGLGNRELASLIQVIGQHRIESNQSPLKAGAIL
jgi:3-hydroxyisobutyrate dehydrogenase-like beta-hydroxyacid dehydrogenase